jgi:hypothetical protein
VSARALHVLWLLPLLLSLAACRRAEKRVLRTEPWLASASASASAGRGVGSARYTVSRGKITIDLRVDGRPTQATLSRVEGSLDIDFRDPARTRAKLSADLMSLTVENGENDEAELRTRALERLGVTEQSAESDRRVELLLTAVEPGPATRRGGSAAAQAELTLHRFRVPLLLELELELGADDAGVPGMITVRTRRPFVVSLSAHGLASEAPSARTTPFFSPRPTLARDARISAEIVAIPATPNDSP